MKIIAKILVLVFTAAVLFTACSRSKGGGDEHVQLTGTVTVEGGSNQAPAQH